MTWQCIREILDPQYHTMILLFENAAKKRNKMSYDMSGIASQKEADEIFKEAREFVDLIKKELERYL